MTSDNLFLGSVQGADPEHQFIFITLSEDYSRITHMSDPMSEKMLRERLHTVMMPEGEINARIKHAGEHPG